MKGNDTLSIHLKGINEGLSEISTNMFRHSIATRLSGGVKNIIEATSAAAQLKRPLTYP